MINERQVLELESRQQAKKLGQFFTAPTLCDYMSSMIEFIPTDDTVRILDAGAGIGNLTISTVKRCCQLGYKLIHAVLYEVDDSIIPALEDNLIELHNSLAGNNVSFSYEIRCRDYILDDWWNNEGQFHFSVINPPYFEFNSKHSPYSNATKHLYKGNPNIYASFIAKIMSQLHVNGQLVVISPRSFTSGLYFTGFRNFILRHCSLDSIHIFKSRKDVFRNMNVLQENIISKFSRRDQQPNIEIRSSLGMDDIDDALVHTFPSEIIIDYSNKAKFIRVPENHNDFEVLRLVDSWKSDFQKNGYYISTGPVVKHRSQAFLTQEKEPDSVPLLQMHNTDSFRSIWSGQEKKDLWFTCTNESKNLLVKNTVYVLLKRFSSKEQKHRLMSFVHDPATIETDLIGLENHLNYIGLKNSGMELVEAYGLAALLNSELMDRYFRCISEIRLLKFPDRETVLDIGKLISNHETVNQDTIDNIVNSVCR
jgi:adenine-specific DNA-methyltransferase